MENNSENYDLVLVVEYFRSATAYLSIIKGLVSKYSIGIYQVEICDCDAKKNNSAQVEFVNECVRLGANKIISEVVNTKVLLIPQRPLKDNVIHDLHKRFKAKTAILLLAFAYAGLKKQDKILQYFEFKKAYAIDKDFIKFLADKRGASKIYNEIDIVEVGLPFKKHPITDGFNVDYILAMPTLFSFSYERDKWAFLETVQRLMTYIAEDDTIVHKPHNGSEQDQFSSSSARLLLQKLNFFPGKQYIFKLVATYSPIKKIRDLAGKLYTAYLYEKVLVRTITMEQAGGYPNFAMEAYLPGVNKGVIGGTSNTMWGTLFFNLPYFNCVDLLSQKRHGENKLYGKKKPENFIELNLQYFMVPYCDGKYVFDEKLWDIPSVESRNGDLIEELRRDITSCQRREK